MTDKELISEVFSDVLDATAKIANIKDKNVTTSLLRNLLFAIVAALKDLYEEYELEAE